MLDGYIPRWKLLDAVSTSNLESFARGLTTVPEEGAFEILDGLYSTKQLEYIVTGAKQFPTFGLVEVFSAKLFNAVSTDVGFYMQFDSYVDL